MTPQTTHRHPLYRGGCSTAGDQREFTLPLGTQSAPSKPKPARNGWGEGATCLGHCASRWAAAARTPIGVGVFEVAGTARLLGDLNEIRR
jgi:hypothetical protein